MWPERTSRRQRNEYSGSTSLLESSVSDTLDSVQRDPDPDIPCHSFWDFFAAVACFLFHPHGSSIFALQVYLRGGAYAAMFAGMTVMLGGPMLLYEATIGRCSKTHPVHAFRICPLVQGIGYGMLFCSMMMLSFESLSLSTGAMIAVLGMMFPHGSDLIHTTVYDPDIKNDTAIPGIYKFYYLYVGSQNNFHGTGFGAFRQYLMMTMTFSWLLLFIFGIRNTGLHSKVLLLGALLPLQIFMAWLLTALTLRPDAFQAVRGIFEVSTAPDFEMAAVALLQSLTSLGAGCGLVIQLGALTQCRWPRRAWWAYALALLLGAKELLFAALAAASLGASAAARNASLHSLVHGQIIGLDLKVLYLGLEFVSFAEFWKIFIFSLYWIAEFYYALLLLRCVVAGIKALPFLQKVRYIRATLTSICCLAFLALGILCCFRNTARYAMMWEMHQPKLALTSLSMLEIVAGAYCFGFRELLRTFNEGMRYYPDIYTRFCWLALPVAILTATLISSSALCTRRDCLGDLIETIVVLLPVVLIGIRNIRLRAPCRTFLPLSRSQPQHPT